MDNYRKLGTEKEKLAVRFLKKKGYRILETNFRTRLGEIDIIAKNSEYIIFVEVKYRKDIQKGYPAEAVHNRKQYTIIKVAQQYLMKKGQTDVDCRFDIVEILGDTIRHIENAFWM